MRTRARYLVKKKARLLVAGKSWDGETQDMHERGIRLRLLGADASNALVGESAELEVEFEAHGAVRVPCVVRRVIGPDIGLSFETLKARIPGGRNLTLEELIPPSAPML